MFMVPCTEELKRNHIRKILKTTVIIVFVLYSMLMIWELFLGNYRTFIGNRNYNLIPFKTVTDYIISNRHYSAGILFINLIANIIVFIPLGFLLPIIKENMRSFFRVVFVSFIIILGAESLQYIFNVGIFDVDDIILNMLGVMIGYIGFKIVHRIYSLKND